jgi:pSer/pThr/pTyr-binding forkhead associated (FHA) protein
VPPIVLTVLKVIFLGLLYFFIWRAFRSVVVGLRPPAPPRGSPAVSRSVRPPRTDGKPPKELVVLDEKGGRSRTVRLGDGQLNIGRAEACQLQLGDTYVSSFHARIYQKDGSWFVEDLGSTNGTYLNQRRLTAPAALQAGDRVRVGKTTMELRR